MSKRLRQEDGIALVMALGITVVLIIFVASMISYTSLELACRHEELCRSDGHAIRRCWAERGLLDHREPERDLGR